MFIRLHKNNLLRSHKKCLLIFVSLWLGVFFLTGCAPLQRLSKIGDAVALYDLTPKSTFPEDLPEITAQLIIEIPVSNALLDSNRIVLRPTPLSVEYFADIRWADRAPGMVQTLLIESFENSGKIISVSRQALNLRADYVMHSELREFHVLYYLIDQSPLIEIQINAKIVRQPEGVIIASRNFGAKMLAREDKITEIIDGFDLAIGDIMKDIVVWGLETIADD